MSISMIAFLLTITFGATPSSASVRITEETAEGRACFTVKTSSATYVVDKRNGGLVRLLDCDGVDWVGWSRKPGASGEYRGIPNCVNGKGRRYEGFGHPGFDVAVSEVVAANSIRTRTDDGSWSLRWEFFDSHATVAVEKVPAGEAYWFLYEGVPAGKYVADKLKDTFWGTDKDGRRDDRPPLGKQSAADGKWRWVYWGHQTSPRVLFLERPQDDGQHDLMAYMNAKQSPGDGMVVFGFGRGRSLESELRRPNTFRLGFIEAKDHQAIAAGILQLHDSGAFQRTTP
jgi:hypothetical protein